MMTEPSRPAPHIQVLGSPELAAVPQEMWQAIAEFLRTARQGYIRWNIDSGGNVVSVEVQTQIRVARCAPAGRLRD